MRSKLGGVSILYERIGDEILHFFANFISLCFSGLFAQCYSHLGTGVLGKI